jgi:DNA invertase Pin-like site-specific DNA recombinase
MLAGHIRPLRRSFTSKGLNEALAYVRPGDTFMVWKLDRAGRSLKHLIELLKGLQERGIEFMSLTEQIDTTTPGGKLIRESRYFGYLLRSKNATR